MVGVFCYLSSIAEEPSAARLGGMPCMVVSFNNGVLIGGNGMPWLRRIISLKHATCKSTALPSKWMWYLYAQNLLMPLLSPEVTRWQIS